MVSYIEGYYFNNLQETDSEKVPWGKDEIELWKESERVLETANIDKRYIISTEIKHGGTVEVKASMSFYPKHKSVKWLSLLLNKKLKL